MANNRNCRQSNNPNKINANPKLGNQYKNTSLNTNPDDTRSPVDRKTIALISAIIWLVACGQKDKQAQIKELESQRDALTVQIETLRVQIARETGDIFSGKISSSVVTFREPLIMEKDSIAILNPKG